jgi:hypothetical protein
MQVKGKMKLRVLGLDPYKDFDLSAFQDSKPQLAQVEGASALKA